MKLRTILATSISTALVVATLAVTPSAGTPVDDLITANYQDTQWSLKSVRAQAAWTEGATGDGVTVAVIDTGVDATHPDLAGSIVDGATITYDGSNPDNAGISITPTDAADFTDEEGHGTHVSGIITANHNSFGVTGLAYDADIMPIKLTNLGDMDLPAFAQALDDALAYAAANGALVANLSLGGPALEESNWITLTADDLAYKAYTDQICQAVTDATTAGVLVVAAAGNYYQQGNPALVPSTCADAYSVASASPNTTSTSYFSTTDPGVDITAPGESIFSTFPTTQFGGAFADFPYAEMSGTSMATPLVVAAAADYIDIADSPTPAQIRTAINSTATNMTAISGWDPYSGWGMLDAGAMAGGESVRTTLAAQPYMTVLGGRESNNFAGSMTVLWDAPAEGTLPDSYDVVITEKTSEVVHTYGFASGDVRGVIPWLEIDDYSYIQVIAHYSGHDLASPPFLFSVPISGSDTPSTPTGLNYTLGDDAHLSMTWDQMVDPNIDHFIIVMEGNGIAWTYDELYRIDGDLPTRFDTYLAGSDPMNTDFTINLIPVGEFDNWGEWAELTHYAKAPAAITFVQLAGNKVIHLNAAPNRAGCNLERESIDACLGRKISYNYSLSTFGGGLTGGGSNTGSRGGVAPRSPSVAGYLNFEEIWFDNIATGLGNNGVPRVLTLTPQPLKGGNGGIYRVNVYLNLPVGTTPSSLRKDAGLPALK